MGHKIREWLSEREWRRTLFLGIEDSGVVTGVKLDRNGRDNLPRRLGQVIKEFYPAVVPDLYTINFAPVLDPSGAAIGRHIRCRDCG